MSDPDISIVVPVFNEQESIPKLNEAFNEVMDHFDKKVEILLVDDGSIDNTYNLLKNIVSKDSRYKALVLSRNYGHQMAISAGLKHAKGREAVMIIDGDLQDPPQLLVKFYEKFKEGFDVVYAIRKNRKEHIFKRFAYYLFYRVLKSASEIQMPLDSGDFSLMSRRVVNYINKMPEESRFIRGMRSWVGFNQIGIPYDREKRNHGEAKYTIRKLIRLAYNGILNFSEFPIKLITYIGLVSLTISLLYFSYTLMMKIFYDSVPEGFTATIFVIILFSSAQLISLGMIGEYVTRIFYQVKKRPLFIVKEEISNDE